MIKQNGWVRRGKHTELRSVIYKTCKKASTRNEWVTAQESLSQEIWMFIKNVICGVLRPPSESKRETLCDWADKWLKLDIFICLAAPKQDHRVWDVWATATEWERNTVYFLFPPISRLLHSRSNGCDVTSCLVFSCTASKHRSSSLVTAASGAGNMQINRVKG